MGLKFNRIGESMKGFAIASKKRAFGEVDIMIDPETICDYVD